MIHPVFESAHLEVLCKFFRKDWTWLQFDYQILHSASEVCSYCCKKKLGEESILKLLNDPCLNLQIYSGQEPLYYQIMVKNFPPTSTFNEFITILFQAQLENWNRVIHFILFAIQPVFITKICFYFSFIFKANIWPLVEGVACQPSAFEKGIACWWGRAPSQACGRGALLVSSTSSSPGHSLISSTKLQSLPLVYMAIFSACLCLQMVSSLCVIFSSKGSCLLGLRIHLIPCDPNNYICNNPIPNNVTC